MFTVLLSVLLIINELMASNTGEVMSPATNFDSWIEFYNPGSEAVTLDGMYLSDDPSCPQRWQLPPGVGTVPAKGFLVVWLGSNDIKSTQAPFKLSCSGGTIILSDATCRPVVTQHYPAALSRTAWARQTDGTGEFLWTAMPTPGESNATATFASQRLAAPVVSHGSMLFTSDIAFKVDIPEGTTLMYTIDGSLPSATASQSSRESSDGRFLVNKTTNYTFRLFRDGYLPSVPVTRSFIKTNHQYTIPVISIVGDRRYFEDSQWGIDTEGSNGRPGNGQNQPCNYNMDWERPVNFSYLSPEGVMLFNQDAEISISGGWTRSASPRSFKLNSGREFDQQNRFEYPFFADKPYIRNKMLLIRNGGNDIWENNTRFTDPALQTILQRSAIDLDLQCYQPVIEYVNGEFRGVLNLREPNNKKFVDANYGYSDDEIDLFEMDVINNLTFKEGTADVLNRIYELGEHITDEGAYDELLRHLDIDEYTNYMAMELFLGSTDWPNNNLKAFRSRHDGRYRFITFDLDLAFKSDDPFNEFMRHQTWTFSQNYETGGIITEEIPLVTFFLNMMKHDTFRRRFIDTFCLMGGSVFEKQRAFAIIDELAERIRPMTAYDGHQPDSAVYNLKNHLENRESAMMLYLQQFRPAALTGVKMMNVLLHHDTEGARLFANGLEVPYAAFSGHLFAPVTLEAVPPAGHRFTGWRDATGKTVATEAVYSLPEQTTIELTACFQPLDDSQSAAVPPVRINEVSAANGVYVNDHWKRNDWVELYNTTSEPIDVEGLFLSDDPGSPLQSLLTAATTTMTPGDAGAVNTVIPPHGYLIVWCDKLNPLSQLHAPFKLQAEGGTLVLTAADGSWTDTFTYSAMDANQTAVRFPDGGDKVYTVNVPTIEKRNLLTSYAVAVDQSSASAISEPAALAGTLTVRCVAGHLVISGAGSSDSGSSLTVSVVSLSGQRLLSATVQPHDGHADVAVSHLPAGVYIASVTVAGGDTSRCKFILQ